MVVQIQTVLQIIFSEKFNTLCSISITRTQLFNLIIIHRYINVIYMYVLHKKKSKKYNMYYYYNKIQFLSILIIFIMLSVDNR